MFQCNLSKYAGYIPDLLSASAASIDLHLSHSGGTETAPAKLGDTFNWDPLIGINLFICILAFKY